MNSNCGNQPWLQATYRRKDSMRKNSIKNTRINGEVQRELSVIIRKEIKDERLFLEMTLSIVKGRELSQVAQTFINYYMQNK